MKTSADPIIVFSHPIYLLAFGFGTGLSPLAPGTVGTLVGFPLYWSIMWLPSPALWGILVVFFVAGIWICDVTGEAVGEADHSGIVWDEIVCFAMVLAFTPFSPLWWFGAFVAFRFFDIFKLWPASWIDQNLKTGFGVMADDLVAALYAIAVILTAQFFIH